MLSNWSSKKESFIKIMPIEYKAALEKLKEERINQLINQMGKVKGFKEFDRIDEK